MASLTAHRFVNTFHVDLGFTLAEHPIAFPIFVDPFVDSVASWLRTETSVGISMEESTGNDVHILTAQRTGVNTFHVVVPST